MNCSTFFRSRIASFVAVALMVAASLVIGPHAYASCSNPANPIEAENCLAGNPSTEWDIAYNGSNSGDPSIQGFATDISFNVGSTVSFKVNTNATSYVLNIYRVGYYGGMGARLVATVNPSVSLPQVQPACVFVNSTFTTDCGNWAVSASWQVPSTATSGVYFAHVIRSDTGGDSHIFFVVRNDASTSDVLYQTSDMTWQAYNKYGGYNLYGASEVTPADRAFAVSYNRPITTRGDSETSNFFWAEYPMIRWLEANGYNVSYISGMDASRYGSLLLQHKLFLSSGHDEYWDTVQRPNVQAARDAGVNLAFFSGNEVFWKTRWGNSLDGTNAPYRTLVCYKETFGDVVDPMDPPVWTGTWQDPSKSPPADGGQPQNLLTGTFFKVNGPGNDNVDLSIQVPSADGQMRFWRNTNIASQAPNHVTSLPAGTLGYEWDVDADNLFRPAGLFDLSTATYNLTTDYLLNYGTIYGSGTATHHMTMYRAPSGALVFGSGTVQWSWGLDSNHDGDVFPDPDPDMEQATVNLFADMGIQPATLLSGLQLATQSTDTTPPVSTITSPVQGATFTSGSVVAVNGTAVDAGGGVVGGVEVSTDGGQTWHPAVGRSNWTYSWIPSVVGTSNLLSRAVDDSGNLENPQSSGGNPSGGVPVTVAPQVCPCTIWNASSGPSLADSGDTNSVEVGVKFRSDNDGFITGLRFYKASTNTGTHIAHLWTTSGSLLATATFTGESSSGWQQVQFASPVPVSANTVYIASYFAPSGHYADDLGYFQGKGMDNPPMHALADGVSGHNGLYGYSPAPGGFPTNSYIAPNYWVDVVFVNGSTFDLAGQISGVGGAGATITLSGAANATTTTDSNGNYSFAGLVNGTYTVTPGNAGVIFTPASQTVTINNLSLSSVNFSAAASNPVSISGTITGGGGVGTVVTLSGAAFLTTTSDSSGNFNFTGLIAGSYLVTPSQAGYVFTPGTQPVTLTTTSVSGLAFSAQACPCTTIWQPTVTPSVIDGGDANSVEVGVKFRSDIPGTIQAIRFYKAPGNTGTHIGHLWSSNGTLLGSATFTAESSSGWQEVVLSPPVPVSANTVYTASYFAPSGHYSFDSAYFASSGFDNPPLHALANGVSGADGVYAYGSAPSFPGGNGNGANYWVDLLFMASSPHNLSGTVAGPGGPGATVSLSGGANLSTVADASGNFSFANVYDGMYVLTASQPGFAYTVASQPVTMSGSDITGVTLATLTTCIPCDSIWQGTSVPSVADSGDSQSVNVGVKFRADSDGIVAGLRFYKSALNTGNHVGTLWSSTGSMLGSVTFENESPFGWQQALFPAPISITANTTYVISYLAPQGHYAGDNNYFASSGIDSPPLHALANGVDGSNAVFTYGTSPIFPSQSFSSTNYWVDVLFTPTGLTHAISGTISGPGGPNATVTLSGAATAVATADANGNYSFGALNDGAYSVTPGQTGYAFTPGVQPVTLSGADAPGVNFGTLQSCPCTTVWPPSAVPALIDAGDVDSINVGVKFTSDSDGYIAGLRFYKAPLNVGIHIGTLWTESGTQLGTATFTNESSSGWQQVLFDTAVPVTANTTYIASYLAPAGHYADDLNFFATNGVDNPPLHALANTVDADGVFTYAATTAFPSQTFQAANYWVDVIYAATQTYSIGGTLGLPGGSGATVLLSGASTTMTTADASGNYSFSGLANGAYTVTPQSSLYTFSPLTQTVTVNNGHVLNVNFTSGFGISGSISGSGGPGATVTLSGAASATTIADGSGNFSFGALPNGAYTVTPSNGSYVFTPSSQSATINGASVAGVTFSSPNLLTISGNLGAPGGPGATVLLAGAASASTVADASGNYRFTGLINGSYTITPTNAGFVFSPVSQPIALSGTNSTANFTSVAGAFSISGSIGGPGGPGATVSLSGASVATTAADNAGNYTFSGLVNGSYTVSLSNGSYIFSPPSQNTTISGSSVSALNFGTLGIVSIVVNPSSVLGGTSATGTITLSAPAPASGAVVGLSSSNTAAAQVPATVAVVGGATTATFTVTSSPVATNTSLTISATLGATQTASFTVTVPAPSSVSVNPISVVGGSSSTGTVTLNGRAPAGGAIVTLSSSNIAAAQVPASVTVAANATAATFAITTNPVPTSTPLTISATYGSTQGASFTVVAAVLSAVTLNPTSLPGGAGSTGTLTLNGPAPAGGAVVTLSSSNTAAAQVPATITIPANASTATFTVTTSVVASNTAVTLSAVYNATQTASLTVTNASLSSVTLSPTSVLGGTSSTGRVTLAAAAPTGGAVVILSSTNTAVAQVPSSVTVAAGTTTATFTVTTTPVGSNATVTIGGTYGVSRTGSLTVTAPTLTGVGNGITLSATSVVGGTSSTGTVRLTGPAPTGGAVVTLSSSNTAAARVPASVTVAAGATSATFTVTTSPVTGSASVTITATYGVARTATLTVTPPTLTSVTLNPTSVTGATSSTGTVTLTGPAPSAGALVTLSSSNTAAARVPASVTVPAGASSATFTVTTSPVANNASVTITGTYGVARTATLTVTAATMTSVTLNPTSVTGATPSTATVTLTGPAPSGGAVVTLSSSNTAAATVPASVTVPANATTATFTVTTKAVAANTSVTITATRGTTQTAALTVQTPVASALTLNPTSVRGLSPSTGTVTISGPAPSGGSVVTLSSSNTGVATVPASVTVAAGNTSATFTVTTRTVTTSTNVTISATKGVARTAVLTVTR